MNALEFIQSDALYTLLFGYHGSGKTTAGLIRILDTALQRNKKRKGSRWAIVQNTYKSGGNSVGDLIDHWDMLCHVLPDAYVVWENTAVVDDRVLSCFISQSTPLQPYSSLVVRLDFYSVDDVGDSNFLASSLSYDGVWFDDVHRWQFDAKYVRQAAVLTRRSTEPSIQITSNVLSTEHWANTMWQLSPGGERIETRIEQSYAQERIRQQSAVFFIEAPALHLHL